MRTCKVGMQVANLRLLFVDESTGCVSIIEWYSIGYVWGACPQPRVWVKCVLYGRASLTVRSNKILVLYHRDTESDAFCLTLIQTMLCMSASSNSILAVNHAKECPLLLCFIFINPKLAYPHVSCSWCSPLTFPSPSYTSHSPTPSPPSSLYSPRSPLFPPPLSIYLPISWHFFRRRYDAWHFPLAPPMHA